jgi:phosphatidylserine decarboxylase
MLSGYGKREWIAILAAGVVVAAPLLYLHYFWCAAGTLVLVLALLSFFRDPPRKTPPDPGAMVSPADGVVSSIHEVDPYPPLGEPAVCVRIFLSVLNVHVNRSPCAAQVGPITYQTGTFRNALDPDSARTNESNLIVLHSTEGARPIAAVRQVSGAIARRIVCGVTRGRVLRRGQRFGMIKFGSTTELYLPRSAHPRIEVTKGQRVYGGVTILAFVPPESSAPSPPGRALR